MGIFGWICWNAGKDIAEVAGDSILSVKEHIDNTLLTTETPRLQAPTTARRVATPAAPDVTPGEAP